MASFDDLQTWQPMLEPQFLKVHPLQAGLGNMALILDVVGDSMTITEELSLAGFFLSKHVTLRFQSQTSHFLHGFLFLHWRAWFKECYRQSRKWKEGMQIPRRVWLIFCQLSKSWRSLSRRGGDSFPGAAKAHQEHRPETFDNDPFPVSLPESVRSTGIAFVHSFHNLSHPFLTFQDTYHPVRVFIQSFASVRPKFC